MWGAVLGLVDVCYLCGNLNRDVEVVRARYYDAAAPSGVGALIELDLFRSDSWTGFAPAHAQFVLLAIPRLSLVPHPFSCVPSEYGTCATPSTECVFALFVTDRTRVAHLWIRPQSYSTAHQSAAARHIHSQLVFDAARLASALTAQSRCAVVGGSDHCAFQLRRCTHLCVG